MTLLSLPLSYRPLSEQEMTLLGKQQEAYTEWKTWIDYALGIYGPKAHQIAVYVDSEYNDEGGFYSRVRSISISDQEGRTLERPEKITFQSHPYLEELISFDRYARTLTREQIEGECLSEDSDEYSGILDEIPMNNFPHQEGEETYIYTVDHPPKRDFPVVYVHGT